MDEYEDYEVDIMDKQQIDILDIKQLELFIHENDLNLNFKNMTSETLLSNLDKYEFPSNNFVLNLYHILDRANLFHNNQDIVIREYNSYSGNLEYEKNFINSSYTYFNHDKADKDVFYYESGVLCNKTESLNDHTSTIEADSVIGLISELSVPEVCERCGELSKVCKCN